MNLYEITFADKHKILVEAVGASQACELAARMHQDREIVRLRLVQRSPF